MKNINEKRRGCKDNFNAFMVQNAMFEGKFDIPICPSTLTKFPKKIITFEEAKAELQKKHPDFQSVVCFYKDDYKFDSNRSGIWTNPFKWIPLLSQFEGVIQPDFSTNQDFPITMKLYNQYRMRAVGCFLVDNGIPVVANYRSGTEETFEFCTDGIVDKSLVCVSTHGGVKRKQDRKRLIEGVKWLITKKSPSGLIIYGSMPKELSLLLNQSNIPYKVYQTDMARRMGVTV